MEFITIKAVATILHLFGVAIGAGGAYMSDSIYFSSIHNGSISRTELRFLSLGSLMTWAGLGLLVISGIGIFSTDIEKYLHSPKFLAKMSIVVCITLNGILFHFRHMHALKKMTGVFLPGSKAFHKKSHLIYASGAISVVSWSAAIVLGGLPQLPFSYFEIIGLYLIVMAVAVLVSQYMRARFCKENIRFL